ncbi:hypothetical protein [Streptomyces sp. NPDC007905]
MLVPVLVLAGALLLDPVPVLVLAVASALECAVPIRATSRRPPAA